MRTSGSAGWTADARDQLVDRGDPERRVDLGVELLAQRPLDARAQLRDRVELARRARELVVDLRQDLLLHLAHGDLDVRARPSASGKSTCFVSPAVAPIRADSMLGSEPSTAELDDRVRLRLAVGVDEVDEERVAGLSGAVAGRRELRHRVAQCFDLGVDRLLRHLDLRAGNLERRPVDELRERLHVDRRD